MTSIVSLLILIFVGIASAAVSIEYQKPMPGKTPFCMDKIEGKKNVGEEWYTDDCAMRRCLTDSQGTPLISSASCGAVHTEDPKCKIVLPEGDLKYPHCCKTIVCE